MIDAIHVGVDTNSYGFAMVSTEPLEMPRLLAKSGQADTWNGCEGWVVAGGDPDNRLQVAQRELRDWCSCLDDSREVHIWCEEALLLTANIETTRKLVMMTGVLYGTFLDSEANAFWHWVGVSTWRKVVLGRGSGKKDFLKDLARRRTLISWRDLGDTELDLKTEMYEAVPDLYDAWCVAAYGRQQPALPVSA